MHITTKAPQRKTKGVHVMKRLLVVLLSLTFIFAVTGCTSSTNESVDNTETKTQEVTTANTDDDEGNVNNKESTAENANAADYDFSSYEKDIRKITKKVNNAKTSSNSSENHKRFFTLKKQIDAVDDELDKLCLLYTSRCV